MGYRQWLTFTLCMIYNCIQNIEVEIIPKNQLFLFRFCIALCVYHSINFFVRRELMITLSVDDRLTSAQPI